MKLKPRRISLLAFLFLLITSIGTTTPVRIILDTDMMGDCDDAGALAVLHALADRGEAEILAVVTNSKEPGNASAAAVDAINTYYGRPDIPIGTDKDGAKRSWMRPGPYNAALRDGFPHDALPDDSMPDALDIYRKVLAASPDGSVTLCSVGALSNLEDLLRSPPDHWSPLSGIELIKAKVRQTVIMGGGFPRTSRHETNIRLDPAAAVVVTNEWPGPILWQGFEVGAVIFTGKELNALSDPNPVKTAYALRPFMGTTALAGGKPSHDQATVLLAVRGASPELWELHEGGRVVVDSDGNTEWKTAGNSSQAYVSIKSHSDHFARIIGGLMSAERYNVSK